MPAAAVRLRRYEELRAAFDASEVAPGDAVLVDEAGRPIAALGRLAPAERYPVLANASWRGGGGGERSPGEPRQDAPGSAGRRQQRSVIKGARGGKLLPGEKARLRREKIESKRAARGAAGGGFDAAEVVEALAEFVAEGRDMAALDPTSKHGLVGGVGLLWLNGCG
jgi:hypothetical protein